MSKQSFVPFPLGEILITQRLDAKISTSDWLTALSRHASGDWGVEMHPRDMAANNRALKTGAIILSHYRAANGTLFWILTDAQRSATTALLPEEY